MVLTYESTRVGEKVFLARSGSWTTCYYEGTVIKVTPTMVDVQIGTSEPMRFRFSDGRRHCKENYPGSRYREYELDSIPYADRKAAIDLERRTKEAAALVAEIKTATGVNYRWGKQGLATEIARIQDLLDVAKASVEAL